MNTSLIDHNNDLSWKGLKQPAQILNIPKTQRDIFHRTQDYIGKITKLIWLVAMEKMESFRAETRH